MKGGGWLPWRGRTAQDQGTTESNPFQQGWFVPHDIDGMKALMGGQKKFDAELEEFFANVPEDFCGMIIIIILMNRTIMYHSFSITLLARG